MNTLLERPVTTTDIDPFRCYIRECTHCCTTCRTPLNDEMLALDTGLCITCLNAAFETGEY